MARLALRSGRWSPQVPVDSGASLVPEEANHAAVFGVGTMPRVMFPLALSSASTPQGKMSDTRVFTPGFLFGGNPPVAGLRPDQDFSFSMNVRSSERTAPR